MRFILLWIGFNAAYARDLDRALEGVLRTRYLGHGGGGAWVVGRGMTGDLPDIRSSTRLHCPVTRTLDPGEAAAPLPYNVISGRPNCTLRSARFTYSLQAPVTPVGRRGHAHAFKGKRAAAVRSMLDALAGVGLARWTGEGKYVAQSLSGPQRHFELIYTHRWGRSEIILKGNYHPF